MTADQPEGVGQQQGRECGRSYRSGSGRYYDCGRAVDHTGSHLPWPDKPAAPSSTPPARDSGRDEAREAVARWLYEAHFGYTMPRDHPMLAHYLTVADELLALPKLAALLRDGER